MRTIPLRTELGRRQPHTPGAIQMRRSRPPDQSVLLTGAPQSRITSLRSRAWIVETPGDAACGR